MRFLLADDPGAGKTIMAGLLIKELLIRGDLERCLIVAPGGLVEQWQDEMAEKFGLAFDILSRDQIEASLGNGILRAETGGGFQAQNAGERPEFCSQTAIRRANRPKLREFLWTKKPRRFAGTAWWRTQSGETGLRDRARLGNREKHTVDGCYCLFWGPKRRGWAFLERLNTRPDNVLADPEPNRPKQNKCKRNAKECR